MALRKFAAHIIDRVEIAVAKDKESVYAEEIGDILVKTFHNGDDTVKFDQEGMQGDLQRRTCVRFARW